MAQAGACPTGFLYARGVALDSAPEPERGGCGELVAGVVDRIGRHFLECRVRRPQAPFCRKGIPSRGAARENGLSIALQAARKMFGFNWETIGWFAIAASGIVILAAWWRGAGAPGGSAGQAPQGLHVWTEIAWPVLFIAVMGMLTLKEVMGFATVLLLATVLTGVTWAVDAWLLRKMRPADAPQPVFAEMAQSFFPVIVVVFLLRSFLFEPFKIPSASMVPTLRVGDFILVNKFAYGIRLPVVNRKVFEVGLPRQGEVMVFRHPENPAKDLIKRVIGVPGDWVVYRDKRLTINGTPVAAEKTGAFTAVEGDLSMRYFETYREHLGGKAHEILIDPVYPTLNPGQVHAFPGRDHCEYDAGGFRCRVPAGHYLMMGDSRDNSDDSRYWGFVPEDNIVGRAIMVWMNFSDPKRIGTSIE